MGKCRRQANPGLYASVGEGFKKIHAAEGLKGFTLGWFPTLVGYGLQGFGKFGFYEMFKDVYKAALGEKAAQYQTVGFLVSSACAEFIADVLLCPWEALKVRMQTSDEGTFPKTAREGWPKIMNAEGWAAFYTNIFTAPRSSYSKATQLSVTFMSGYFAGIFCAIVSHPADTMVSIMNKTGQGAGEIYRDIGFKGLWSGLGVRIFMIGTLTGLQWWIYDSFKVAVGLQTTGGK